jgi:hypothetical protein
MSVLARTPPFDNEWNGRFDVAHHNIPKFGMRTYIQDTTPQYIHGYITSISNLCIVPASAHNGKLLRGDPLVCMT